MTVHMEHVTGIQREIAADLEIHPCYIHYTKKRYPRLVHLASPYRPATMMPLSLLCSDAVYYLPFGLYIPQLSSNTASL